MNIIDTKWIFRNKTDEEGNVIRNKAKLVAQWYTQVEGVDFDVCTSGSDWIHTDITCLACHLKFKLYQMDVKSVFLNKFLKVEVYVS